MQHSRPTQITINLLHILPSTNASQGFYGNLNMLQYKLYPIHILLTNFIFLI